MITARPIELLAPAKNLDCGMEAVRHGADAVYVGAPTFGARAAAGNSVDDIRTLCDYAHIYDVRVYVALNTILRDDELKIAERMIRQLYDAGADALIVQDMGITQLDIPPIPLHASTQADNATPGKVEFLHRAGFGQIVLARELTLEEIRNISAHVPDATLEAFIHGALCVSYSGRCYLSAALCGRSANRGECAQYCRLPYSLVDRDGQAVQENRHLLSLKDLNRSDDLEAMMLAGISSFKIEGRLKDVSYVKNITAHYRREMDAVFAANPAFYRSSSGHSSFTFTPCPEKSFNRGFTSYFLHGRDLDIASPDTPKSIGEPVGTVKELKGNSFTVAGLKPIHNGDGLAFFNSRGELEGFRVNRTEANRIFPQGITDVRNRPDAATSRKLPAVKPGMPLYRNFDRDFERLLAQPSATRKIGVRVEWGDYPDGFVLAMTDESDARVVIARPFAGEIARTPQDGNVKAQLGKLGSTPFEAEQIILSTAKNYFVPSSLLNDMRREAVDKLLSVRRMRFRRRYAKRSACGGEAIYPQQKLDYTANISNREAERFYKKHGVTELEPSFEDKPRDGVPLMYTKHCLRYSLGWCPTLQGKKSPYGEPYFLAYKDRRLRLAFDCKKCRMLVYDSK
ncbi:MAG: U32 family peptidase [Tannerella sp.]|jgi:putative protease|nr:U32 family peptidase [Tannerella sp.]